MYGGNPKIFFLICYRQVTVFFMQLKMALHPKPNLIYLEENCVDFIQFCLLNMCVTAAFIL